jgi:hypothetical protein
MGGYHIYHALYLHPADPLAGIPVRHAHYEHVGWITGRLQEPTEPHMNYLK